MDSTIQPISGGNSHHKISLDLLRAVAILLVLGRHSFSSGIWHWLGWSGVDLFFVISGFLVSGLLFGELKATGKMRIGRFLARRALKIYPSFYVFLGVSLLVSWATHRNIVGSQLLSEVFYLQSYIDGMWMHTWSLSVEEHFYLSMALVMAIWQKRDFPQHITKTMLWLIALTIVFIALRFGYCWPHRNEVRFDFTATHLRADGIWIGVMLAYAYHFGSLSTWLSTKQWLFAIIFAMSIITLIIWPAGSPNMNTWGITVVCLGFGALLCLSLNAEVKIQQWLNSNSTSNIIKKTVGVLLAIGRHSYSIYLWHLFADNLLEKLGIFRAMQWEDGELYAGGCTILTAIVLGLAMGKLVEAPILRWRNKKFA